MVETITPVVHGGRRGPWAVALSAHVLGATLAASLVGAAVGAMGRLGGAPWGRAGPVVVGLVALAYGGKELFGWSVPLPERRVQVPEWWRSAFPAPVAAFLYGAGLGVGYLTHLRHGTLLAVGAAVLVSADPLVGAVVLGSFGLARAVAVTVTWPATTSDRSGRLIVWLERVATSGLLRGANGVAALLVAAAVAGPAVTGPGGSEAGLAAAVLVGALGWAAVTKVVDAEAWRRSLGAYPLPAILRRGAWLVVPLAEGLVVVLVLAGAARPAGGLAVALLAAFSVAVVVAGRAAGGTLPCGCFGGRRRRSVPALLARNAALGVAAVVTAVREPTLGVVARAPVATEVVPAVLAVIGAALTLVLLRRARALGRARAT